jgi:hypothetical protein
MVTGDGRRCDNNEPLRHSGVKQQRRRWLNYGRFREAVSNKNSL